MVITYWSDYACPYCYIGETYLKKAIKEIQEKDGITADIQIEMKAFELDSEASKQYTGPTVERFAKKYRLSVQEAAERIETISQMGREAGLEFHYAKTRYTNTFDAHRLTKLAQSKPDRTLADRISERLYRAYFSESLELADREVLIRIAKEEGMDESEAREMLISDAYADDVRLDEKEAYRCCVQAVPFFVLGGKYSVPGVMPVSDMKDALRKVLQEEVQTMTAQGMCCGPDGCHMEDCK